MPLPSFTKIVMVIEENHGFSQIIGSSTGAPYINSLITSGALFTDSHGGPDVPHPSFPNYMQLFSGSAQGLTVDTCPPPGQPFSAANLASALIAAGKTFGGYAESQPSGLPTCANTAATFAGRHVPWLWFTNVPQNTWHDFATSWPSTSAGFAALPDVSIVVPNLIDDMHDGTIAQGDSWLQANMDAYIQWAKANNSLFILQFDEDNFTTADHIPTIFTGANIAPGSYSEHITHYNVLRTICDLKGATPMAGAASATPIADCWSTTSPRPVPAFDHIVVVVLENHGVNQIIGVSPVVAPYINSLAAANAYFSQSYGLLHPSSPNYLAMLSGSTQGVTNSTCPPPGSPYNVPNLVADLIAAGKTFGGYAESIPSNPLSCTDPIYDPNHVPWLRFSNIPGTVAHNFTSFPSTSGGFAALPDVSYVIPDGNDSMEASNTAPAAITAGDTWLQAHFSAYVTWAQANNSLLIVTWDEDQGHLHGQVPPGDPHGGGHVVTIFAGAHVVPGVYPESSLTNTVGTTGIDHYNVLRTIEDSLGLPNRGAAASAAPITDCWTSSGPQPPGVPTALAVSGVTSSTVSLTWTAPSGTVTGYDVYVNGTKALTRSSPGATVTGLAGNTAYSFTVDAYNAAGTSAQTSPVTATTTGSQPLVVQTAHGSSAGTTLAITLPASVGAGHGLIIACAGYSGGAISAITIGGTGGLFTRVASSGTLNCEIWAAPSVTQASGAIVITATAPGIIAYAYEVESPAQAAGQVALVAGEQNVTHDQAAGHAGSGTSWSSGATGTTVSGSEFAVGMGLIQNNTGTITGPGGAWSDQPAVTGISAASVSYGAVSGYQVPSAPAAYTYAGTSGTGGQWAAVTATFLLMSDAQVGWAGYTWTQDSGVAASGYTGITATFTIPSFTAPLPTTGYGMSIWVGLGNAFPQTGIYMQPAAGHPGNASVFSWSFFDPGGETWDTTAYPSAPGDTLTCSVTMDSTFVYMTQANSTQGWTATMKRSLQAQTMVTPTHVQVPKAWAEVIIEDEGGGAGALPNYGSVNFTGITVTPAPSGAPVPLAYVDGQDITQVPGPYSGGSFTMTWVRQA